VFVIMTDGMENASRYYGEKKVREMIERQKTRYGWEFLFLAANLDAVETAGHYGIDADRAVNYHADETGTQLNYKAVGEAIASVRSAGVMNPSWRRTIDEDFENRQGNR
jgi:hypothetical protein